MRAEDRILFACARQELRRRHRETVEALAGPLNQPIDWERLAATAELHGVLPIVGANLLRCDPAVLRLPPDLAERLAVSAFENALLKEQDALRLAAGLARLREVGLEAMLLKGAALDLLVYSEPWVVTSHDADLILRPLPGFRPGDAERTLRSDLYRSGIECDLLVHHDVDMNGVLPIPFESIWREARPVRFRGLDAWVMAPEDLLISLCINSCRKRFLRLKGLFDIAETVRRLADLDWERLARKARLYRCEGIVYTALLTTGATVGCDLPYGALEALAVPAARAALLRRLVAGVLRTTSLSEAGGRVGSGPVLSLLLSYASYRWDQAWRSFRFALAHPGAHRPAVHLAG
jgi:hypothetical protein